MTPPPGPSDRYQPLPGLLEIPGFLVRKLSPRGRRLALAAGLALLAAIAVACVVGIPRLVDAKRAADAADARRLQRAHAARLAELRREIRPVSGRGPAAAGLTAPATLQPQRVLRQRLVAAVAADAARRARTGEFAVRARRVECERYPRGIGVPDPADRPGARRARYACLAVTADFPRGEPGSRGAIGYPYRALVDFRAGRFAFCKISGRPGEEQLGRDIHVDVPRACGGG